jgi:Holliday junction resolvase RusA-like endonuclease
VRAALAFAQDDAAFLTFHVDGVPVAKGRARATTIGGMARLYTPGKTRAYEDRIRCAAAMARGERPPFQGEVTLTVTALVAIPASFSKRKRANAVAGIIRPTTRPDADNYAKAALDGCNGILFRDDAQVTDLIVRKRYAAEPRLVITMEAL